MPLAMAAVCVALTGVQLLGSVEKEETPGLPEGQCAALWGSWAGRQSPGLGSESREASGEEGEGCWSQVGLGTRGLSGEPGPRVGPESQVAFGPKAQEAARPGCVPEGRLHKEGGRRPRKDTGLFCRGSRAHAALSASRTRDRGQTAAQASPSARGLVGGSQPVLGAAWAHRRAL